MRSFMAALTAVLLPTCAVLAEDWPQWMGPTRDGIWTETGILEKFPEGGPKKLWSVPVGGGYSGPAVVGGKVFLTDYQRTVGEFKNNPGERAILRGKERIFCVDAKTGVEQWKIEYDCPYSVSYPAGPRCTPTIADGKLYALGSMGDLYCTTLAGEVVWKKSLMAEYKIPVPMWGFCGHPLVYENLLLCLVGGDGTTAVAFEKNTGKEVWRALSSPEPGYCPPSIINAGGVDQLVIWHAKSMNGLDPLTGKRYWSVPLEPNYGMSIMMPRKHGDHLFAGGIGNKSALVKLTADKPGADLVWSGKRTNSLYPVNATPIVDGEMIYGVDQPGQLRGVVFETGERKWATFEPVLGMEKDEDFRGGSSGTAFLVKNDKRYFIFGETGELTIAKLSPTAYKPLVKAKLLEPTSECFGRKVVWSCPAFADKCIFVRNDKELACYSLAK